MYLFIFLDLVLIVSTVRYVLGINESLQMVTPISRPSVQSICVIGFATGMAWNHFHHWQHLPVKWQWIQSNTDLPVHVRYSFEALRLPGLVVQATKISPVPVKWWMLRQIWLYHLVLPVVRTRCLTWRKLEHHFPPLFILIILSTRKLNHTSVSLFKLVHILLNPFCLLSFNIRACPAWASGTSKE